MLYTTKFDMFELIKVRCLNLCMDIYSDVGKFLKSVLDDQDRLFKLVSCKTISMKNLHFPWPESSWTKRKRRTMRDITTSFNRSTPLSIRMQSCRRSSRG